MIKTLQISLILGISLTIQSALANSSQAEVKQASPQTSNQMKQLLETWGLEPTQCQANVIQIKHDVTGETACAVPNQQLQSGNYIYNSTEHTLSPTASQSVTQSETTPTPETPPQLEPADSQALQSKVQEFVFDFNNTYDYATCLDVILLSYEGRSSELENAAQNDCGTKVLTTFGNNLPKDVAFKLVEMADTHATEGLQNPLYPTLGLRRRIAINLGYVYDTDKNNPDILKYVNQDSN
ncbi:MAG: hypothetical protein AAF298_24825 [Cyanobacteria bacterium P01_A01_bin.40]